MTPERYHQLCALIHRAQVLPPAERAAFLQQACAEDPSLRAELEHLLAHDQRAGGEGLWQEPCPVNAKALLAADEPVTFPGAPPAAAAEDALVGRKVGPYVVEQRLGQGGMGTVYRARREDAYRQQVALKVVRPGHDSDEMLTSFRTERQVLADLQHPHIARLLDGGATDDGRPYFVMEYIDGEPLDRFCERRQLDPPARLRLLLAVCAAVQHAHGRGVLQRDLKPANVLVAADGTAKVTDFGLAKRLEVGAAGSAVTASGAVLGTPSYMAPEDEPVTRPPGPPPAEPDEGLLGRRLGPNRIEHRLGRGGMGVVYQAEDSFLKRRVAIKVLPRSAWEDPAALRRLLREAQAVARLSHANIAAIHHVDQWEGGYFLVLEFMPGGSLQARLDRGGALPWPEATRALIDACRGLHAAHAAGFIHRDIKPANLLCDGAGAVKVADFGLVRGGLLTASSIGCIAGTPHYMSPEQCRGEPVDARSDVYALGATYFALLTGRPPYRGDTPVRMMFAHCEAPVPDPRAHVSDVPEACAAIVRKAMAKEPGDRFQSVAEMLAALQALVPGTAGGAEPIPAPPGSARPLPPAPARRSRLRPTTGVMAVLVLVAGLAWVAALGWPGRRGGPTSARGEPQPPADRPPPAVRALGTELPAGGLALPVGGKVQAVVFSHDGKMLAAGGGGPGAAQPGTAGVWDVAAGTELCYLWQDSPFLSLAFSHDGGLLMGSLDCGRTHFPYSGKEESWCRGVGAVGALAFARDGSVFAVGFSAGEYQGHVKHYKYEGEEIGPVIGAGESGPPVQQLLYSPQDHTLAVAYGDGHINLYPPDKPRDPIRVQPAGSSPPPALAFAPDQPVLAVARSRTVHWWNLAQGTWEDRNVSEEDDITALAYTPDGKHLAVAGRGPDVVLHRVATGQKVHTFRGHRGAVYALACHPDGEILATGGGDGEVRVWDLREAIAAAGPGAD